MTPRPLSHELRWLVVGWLLRMALKLAPFPVPNTPSNPDRDPYFDLVEALNQANDAIGRLPN